MVVAEFLVPLYSGVCVSGRTILAHFNGIPGPSLPVAVAGGGMSGDDAQESRRRRGDGGDNGGNVAMLIMNLIMPGKSDDEPDKTHWCVHALN
jgi:hypothetical protein